MDFKIELRSSLVTMVGGMPMGSRGVVMSPNAHDGSSYLCDAACVSPSKASRCVATNADTTATMHDDPFRCQRL